MKDSFTDTMANLTQTDDQATLDMLATTFPLFCRIFIGIMTWFTTYY